MEVRLEELDLNIKSKTVCNLTKAIEMCKELDLSLEYDERILKSSLGIIEIDICKEISSFTARFTPLAFAGRYSLNIGL